MPALIVVTDPTGELLGHIKDHFDDYILLELTAKNKDEYYNEVRKTLDIANTVENQVFLIANGDPAFNALLAAKLALSRKVFYLGEWIGERFKVLKIP